MERAKEKKEVTSRNRHGTMVVVYWCSSRKKTPNFTERQPSASASISLGPNPSLTGWRQSERSWNPWQEKLWESNLRAKPPFFPQTASVRSTTTNLALSNYLAKVISRVRNSFGISFCFARVWHWVNVTAFNSGGAEEGGEAGREECKGESEKRDCEIARTLFSRLVASVRSVFAFAAYTAKTLAIRWFEVNRTNLQKTRLKGKKNNARVNDNWWDSNTSTV